MDFKHKFETETGNSIYSGNGQMLSEGSYSDDFVEYLLKQLTLTDVSITEGELCEICNENKAKVIYKTCYDCEEYIINGEHN